MNKVKFFFIIGNFEFPQKNAPGIRVWGLGKIAQSFGWRVIFIGVTRSKTSVFSKEECEGMVGYSLPYPQSPSAWLRYREQYKNTMRIVQQYPESQIAGIYLYQSLAISLWMKLIFSWCKARAIPCFMDAGDWFQWSGKGFWYGLVKYIDTNYQKRILMPKANVIAVSRFFENYYRKLKTPVFLLPHVTDMKSHKDELSALIESWRINARPELRRLCYVGIPFLIGSRKGRFTKDRLDRTLELLHALIKEGTNFRMDIYGVTKEEYLYVFFEHEKLMPDLEGHVFFHGRKSVDVVRKVIAVSDFTILHRDVNLVTTAGFPTKFVESINLCVPVIAEESSDIGYYLEEGKNGFFLPRNFTEQVNKMQQILRLSVDEIYQMKRNCLEHMIFDYRNYISGFSEFYIKSRR